MAQSQYESIDEHLGKGWCRLQGSKNAVESEQAVCVAESRNGNCGKTEPDYGTDKASYPFETGQPDHIVPSESLECAPETVTDMKVENGEPKHI